MLVSCNKVLLIITRTISRLGVGVGDGVLAVGKVEAGLDAGHEADGGDVQGEVHGEVGAEAALLRLQLPPVADGGVVHNLVDI